MSSIITPLTFKTYLSVVRGSVDSAMFRHIYASVDGIETDVTHDAMFSCAFFVSSILKMFDLVERMHATVASTIVDLEKKGWHTIPEPRIGAVLLWEKEQANDGSLHKHLGFYVGDQQAISNASSKKSPQQHHWTYSESDGKPVRAIEAIYWHEKLSDTDWRL